MPGLGGVAGSGCEVVIVGGEPAVKAAILVAVNSPAAKAQIKQYLKAVAAEGLAYWKSIAPQLTGAYMRSIKMRDGKDDAIRIGTTDYKAHWIEYGTKHQAALAPMEKTRSHLISTGRGRAADEGVGGKVSEFAERLGGEE